MPSVTTKMGLSVWDQPLDPYNYQQLAGDFNIIDFHDHTPGRGVQIPFGGIAPGAIGKTQLTPDVLGSQGTLTIGGTQTVVSNTYTTMPTPDQIPGIVLPANGLVQVWYQATWQESVNGAANAALFLGGNQVAVATNTGAPVSQQASISGGNAGKNAPLTSYWGGLTGFVDAATQYSGDVTTGQVVGASGGGVDRGGSCFIFAAAGTYTISVQFKASSGTVTASNRKLWVRTLFS